MTRNSEREKKTLASEWAESNVTAAAVAPEKKRSYRSIRFQTWTYFFLLAALSLFVLWLFQLVFFKSAYKSMKKQEVERLGDEIAARYPGHAGNPEYRDFLNKTAMNNGLNIIVFRVHEKYESCPVSELKFIAEYLTSQFNAEDVTDKGLIATDNPHIIVNWEEFYEGVSSHESIGYIQHTKPGDFFVYGVNIDGNGRYLYLTTPYQPLESTISVMADQFLIATVVCLVASVVVSFFISDRITKPITEFSRVAKKLSAGDYSVRFKGNGYTEIENLADTLNTATVEFGKTEQLRRDFLANVGHDLRTPLTMVKAYAEMIRDISGSDELKRNQHSQVIIDEADRLTGLVNDILNLSKLQSGTDALELRSTDLRVLAKMVVERFSVYSERDGYTFRFEADEDCFAYCDSKRIEQVIYNLIGNAVSYTGNKTVDIRVSRVENKVRASVRDYGSGIAPEDLDKVWDRYYRANQSKRAVVGSGLGLSIVKNILTLHKAEFGVSSRLGEGTEFWFELSAATPAETAELPAPAETPAKKKRGRKRQ